MNKYLVVILGPTAIGKTEVGIEVAKVYDTEIISADARQCFREMEIGTAKPNAQQLAEVKHHFINHLSISDLYNAGQFEEDALKTLEGIYKSKDVAVMVGGSGLYINAVCNGIDELPTSVEDVRKELIEDLEEKGIGYLQDELKRVDLVYYAEVDLNNPHRIIRALEVYRMTGKPYSLFRNKIKKDRPFKVIKIGLNMERKDLYKRINMRVDGMIQTGLEEEVRGLIPFKKTNAIQTVGYSEWFDYFDGKINRERVIELIKQNSRRYAKRQLTWFGRDEEIKWFHPNEVKEILGYLEEAMPLKK